MCGNFKKYLSYLYKNPLELVWLSFPSKNSHTLSDRLMDGWIGQKEQYAILTWPSEEETGLVCRIVLVPSLCCSMCFTGLDGCSGASWNATSVFLCISMRKGTFHPLYPDRYNTELSSIDRTQMRMIVCSFERPLVSCFVNGTFVPFWWLYTCKRSKRYVRPSTGSIHLLQFVKFLWRMPERIKEWINAL